MKKRIKKASYVFVIIRNGYYEFALDNGVRGSTPFSSAADLGRSLKGLREWWNLRASQMEVRDDR